MDTLAPGTGSHEAGPQEALLPWPGLTLPHTADTCRPSRPCWRRSGSPRRRNHRVANAQDASCQDWPISSEQS